MTLAYKLPVSLPAQMFGRSKNAVVSGTKLLPVTGGKLKNDSGLEDLFKNPLLWVLGGAVILIALRK